MKSKKETIFHEISPISNSVTNFRRRFFLFFGPLKLVKINLADFGDRVSEDCLYMGSLGTGKLDFNHVPSEVPPVFGARRISAHRLNPLQLDQVKNILTILDQR